MKRTATLVAGLLLVTGTVFGASEWKMTGATVEGTYNLMHSEFGALGAEGGDLNLTLKAEKDFGKAGVVGVEAKFDDNDEDNSVKLTYSKTEGDFTVATSAKILEAKESDSSTNADRGAISLKMDEGSDTYIKWNVMGSKTTSLTFYPWEVDGMSWDNDTFESFTDMSTGGLKLGVKVNDTTDFAVKLATHEGTSTTKNTTVVKGEFNTKVAGVTLNAAFGSGKTDITGAYNTNLDEMPSFSIVNELATMDYLNFLNVDDEAKLTPVQQRTLADLKTNYASNYAGEKESTVLAVKAATKVGKVSLNAEVNTETANFDMKSTKATDTTTDAVEYEVTQTAVFVKGAYDMGTMMKYGVTPYAQMEVYNAKVEVKDLGDAKDTKTVIEAGVTLAQGPFSVTPKFVTESVDKADIYDKYGKEDSADTKKSMSKVAVTIKYSM